MAGALSFGSRFCIIDSNPSRLGTKGAESREKKSVQWNCNPPSNFAPRAQARICTSRNLRWWDKHLKPNIREIDSAQEFLDSLSNAGDKLVVVDFYSPGCGGCKALHPKICQIAEENPNVEFLKVNYEELKPLCCSLHIHVLPFFRFYRGAEGRVCSFSCTLQTIKKFITALAKHGTDRCSLGPTRGLEESELLELASNGLISFGHHPRPANAEELVPIASNLHSGFALSSSH